VKLKVNINVTNYKESKMAAEKRTKTEQIKEFVQDNQVLDLLFSYVGVASD
jgi:hypothetical protein